MATSNAIVHVNLNKNYVPRANIDLEYINPLCVLNSLFTPPCPMGQKWPTLPKPQNKAP